MVSAGLIEIGHCLGKHRMRKQRHETFESVERMLDHQCVAGQQTRSYFGDFLTQALLKGCDQFAQLDIVSGKFLGASQVKPR